MKLKISLAAPVVFLLAVFSISAAIPPAESLLPADTLLMFTVPDCSVVRAAAQKSPQWLLWNDPAMKPFRLDFTAKWNARFLAPSSMPCYYVRMTETETRIVQLFKTLQEHLGAELGAAARIHSRLRVAAPVWRFQRAR